MRLDVADALLDGLLFFVALFLLWYVLLHTSLPSISLTSPVDARTEAPTIASLSTSLFSLNTSCVFCSSLDVDVFIDASSPLKCWLKNDEEPSWQEEVWVKGFTKVRWHLSSGRSGTRYVVVLCRGDDKAQVAYQRIVYDAEVPVLAFSVSSLENGTVRVAGFCNDSVSGVKKCVLCDGACRDLPLRFNTTCSSRAFIRVEDFAGNSVKRPVLVPGLAESA